MTIATSELELCVMKRLKVPFDKTRKLTIATDIPSEQRFLFRQREFCPSTQSVIQLISGKFH